MKILYKLSVICLAFFINNAYALLFDKEQRNGQKVLIIRDCGKGTAAQLERDKSEFGIEKNGEINCPEFARHFVDSESVNIRGGYFYKGDGETLSEMLSKEKFSIAILHSGGGEVTAGYKVGRLLREYQIDTVVESGTVCISACTFTFLGGFVRQVMDGASYQVHSASAYSGLSSISNTIASNFDNFVRVMILGGELETNQPNTSLRLDSTSKSIAQFFVYLKEMYGLKGGLGVSYESEIKWKLDKYAEECKTAYLQSEKYAIDKGAVANGDITSLNNAFINVERSAAICYIGKLKQIVGPKGSSGAAVRFMERMYTSDIRFTNELTQEELRDLMIINDR